MRKKSFKLGVLEVNIDADTLFKPRRTFQMDTRLAKRNYNIQQWKTIIQDRNNTNLTVDEYCKQNGLSRNSYFYWLDITLR